MTQIGPATRSERLRVARQFCTFLFRRDSDAACVDMELPRFSRATRLPYILLPNDFGRIIDAIPDTCQKTRHPLTVKGVEVALNLLYATGLRIGEAFRLTTEDVDLDKAVLLIRDTKFFKSRLVPISHSTNAMLREFARERDACLGVQVPDASFFPSLANRQICVNESYVRDKFREAAEKVLAARASDASRPRIHDLRHGFAVRRLLQWYREGADVQNKLPLLSTYLGHVNIAATQVYITAIAPLLDEAALRFARYAGSLVTPNEEQAP